MDHALSENDVLQTVSSLSHIEGTHRHYKKKNNTENGIWLSLSLRLVPHLIVASYQNHFGNVKNTEPLPSLELVGENHAERSLILLHARETSQHHWFLKLLFYNEA